MPVSFILPVPAYCVVTQTAEQHKANAIRMNCAWKPGMNKSCWYYPGVDLAALWSVKDPVPVFAAAEGEVIQAGPDSGGYGLHVRIKHPDGDITIYAHLEKLKVKAGVQVKAGDTIGIMGSTGNSTGRHLHWEWRKGGTMPTDPWPLVNGVSPAPVVEQPNTDLVVVIPPMPKARVVNGPLYIRIKPTTNSGFTGTVPNGEEVEVLGVERDGNNRWFRIGYKQYMAAYYNGKWLSKLV